MEVSTGISYFYPSKHTENGYYRPKNQLTSATRSRARIESVLNFKGVCRLFLMTYSAETTIILYEIKISLIPLNQISRNILPGQPFGQNRF